MLLEDMMVVSLLPSRFIFTFASTGNVMTLYYQP